MNLYHIIQFISMLRNQLNQLLTEKEAGAIPTQDQKLIYIDNYFLISFNELNFLNDQV